MSEGLLQFYPDLISPPQLPAASWLTTAATYTLALMDHQKTKKACYSDGHMQAKTAPLAAPEHGDGTQQTFTVSVRFIPVCPEAILLICGQFGT